MCSFINIISHTCDHAGVTFYYSIEQMCIWAVLHAAFLFWAIYFPFSYRRLQMSGKMRYAHIISVLLALILPLLGALIPLKEGHIIGRNPSYTCFGRNSNYTFYTFILPVSISMAVTLSLLMLTFLMIFKVGRLSQFWNTVKPLIKDIPKENKPPNNGQTKCCCIFTSYNL